MGYDDQQPTRLQIPNELAYLWTTVRRVSKGLDREIENLFLEEHIGKTWIYSDCGKSCKTPEADHLILKKFEGNDITPDS